MLTEGRWESVSFDNPPTVGQFCNRLATCWPGGNGIIPKKLICVPSQVS